MVVGSGLISKAFDTYKDNENVIIFASGVSNSKETNIDEFNREFDLLKSYQEDDKKLIYFSTCSIFDYSLSNLDYIKHKIKIENYISNNLKKYLILRLPNVVGTTNNNNTFFNYFRNKIISGEELYIQKNASRYLIDIDDLSKNLPNIIDENKLFNKSINICFNNKLPIIDIIEIMEEILKIKSKKTIIDGGCDYNIDNKEFMSVINIDEYGDDYNYKTLKKYLL